MVNPIYKCNPSFHANDCLTCSKVKETQHWSGQTALYSFQTVVTVDTVVSRF